MALHTLGSPDVGWEVPAGKPAFYNLCVPFFFLYISSLRESRKQGKEEPIMKTLPGMAGFFGLLE